MAVIHEFVSVEQSIDKEILHSAQIYEYVEDGIVKKINTIEIEDDRLQNMLYDKKGKLCIDLKFNRWGITVYETEDLEKWIAFLRREVRAIDKKKQSLYQELLQFMITAQCDKRYVIHFGI